MRTVAVFVALGGLALVGCKKSVPVDLGMELGEQITVLEPMWEADPKGERGKLGVPVRLTNPLEEAVSVSQLKVDVISGGKRQCGETKSLERSIEPGGKIKMRVDIVCHWNDLKSGFRAEVAIDVDSESAESAVLTMAQDNVQVHK